MGGADRPATPSELDQMRALVRQALAQGAVGLSTGLEYTPGSFAALDELTALAGELRGTPYPYASHMRNEDDRLLAALEEALHVGRVAGVPVQVSHLKAQGERNYWKADAALSAIEAARAAGVDAHFDRYPYTAYATGPSPTSSRRRLGRAAAPASWSAWPTRPRVRRWSAPAERRSPCWGRGTPYRSSASEAATPAPKAADSASWPRSCAKTPTT